MSEFDDFDVEVQDERDSDPEHFNGDVTTAGSPETVTPTSGKAVQLAFIQCNSTRDPVNDNNINDALYFSIDGGTTYVTLMAGENIFVPGVFTSIKLDTNTNGTYYQIIVWS